MILDKLNRAVSRPNSNSDNSDNSNNKKNKKNNKNKQIATNAKELERWVMMLGVCNVQHKIDDCLWEHRELLTQVLKVIVVGMYTNGTCSYYNYCGLICVCLLVCATCVQL